MDNNIVEFETPENVQVRYRIAGLGSRFIAWIEDQLLIFLFLICFMVLFLLLGLGTSWMGKYMLKLKPIDVHEVPLYLIGVLTLIMGFASFLYFALSELLMRGQTIGKKHMSIRVVKVNGYALDAGSVLMRNIFRVLDNTPVFWIVPMVSPKSQRLGDMVAGTICIFDEPKRLGTLRETLTDRNPAEREFRFDAAALKRARPSDTTAVERILESRPSLSEEKFTELLGTVCDPLADRLQVERPAQDKRARFLEDYLAAHYQRLQRNLG